MPLLGEAIGIIETVWQKGVAVVAITALSGLSLYLLNENYIGWGWLITVAPITTFVIIYVWLFRKQVDARQQAQQYLEELEHANRQLAEYADRIEDLTLVSERQRMARELHDTLAQGLAGLILQLEAADSHLSSGRSDRAQTIVQQAMGRARNTLGEARKVIDDLRAGPATAGGLAEALEKEVQRFISASGISCDLKLNLPPTLPDEISEHLLRMVAEGLVNVERHARASRAWVRVEYSSGNLNIEVGDDGIGFDPQLTLQRPGHYGLLGMRERARLAGGAMQIRSKPGEGATIEMRLPLNSPAEPGEPTKLPTWQGNKKHES
jgi:NarL family two-component system sensor histidine kinase YdfH